MRALVKTQQGLELQEVPLPSPGPREVVVKVKMAALCRTDVYLAQGKLEAQLPLVLGHEGSGVIYRLGKDVPQDLLGQRVSIFPWDGCRNCQFCREDQEQLYYRCSDREFLGWQRPGLFAEYVCITADRAIPIPDELSYQAAAFLEPLTAALGLVRAPLKEAKQVGLLGANRIASLSSTVLGEVAQCEHECFTAADSVESKYDLVVETEATDESIRAAIEALIPGGLLVMKSRPPENISWPYRLQVEKEIRTLALSYGSLRMARMLLTSRGQLFQPLWAEPVDLRDWPNVFGKPSQKKVFFRL